MENSYVLITDLHFGCRNNSMTWFNSQLEFFEKQFIPYIKQHSGVQVVCLGDIFDIRASISTYIATHVRALFEKIASISPMIIIAGNHDFYSPVDDNYCSIEVALADINNVTYVIREELLKNGDLFVPWYVQERVGLQELISKYNPKRIFTHADIVTSGQFSIPVYSGHIHTPYISGSICNLGATYPLTFADANSDRYFYLLNGLGLHPIKNEHCIKFWRLYNEEIFVVDWDDVSTNDYIEIYIDSNLLSQEKYQKKISALTKTYRNIWTIPQAVQCLDSSVDIKCDMVSIIEQSIPDELKEKFEYIKSKLEV